MALLAAVRPRLFRSWLWRAFFVAVAALSILLLFDRGLFVPDTKLGWMDAWYYVSFGRRLPYYVNRFWFIYQSERIGWTLPIYAANLLAGPLLGNYLVKGVFYVATLVFLFGSIRQLCSDRAAALVSILAAFQTFVVHSLGAGYSDGAANAYLLATVFFLNRAVLSERVRLTDSVLAGLCLAGQLFAHFATILLSPILVLYMMIVRFRQFRTLHGVATVFVACCAGAALGYEAVHRLYLHWGVPSRPLLESFLVLWSHDPNPMVRPDGLSWLRDATWLVVPASVLLWAILTLASAKRSDFSIVTIHPYCFLAIAAGSVWLALYVVAHAPWLMLPFYVSYLLPPTFLALGALAADMTSMLSRRMYYGLLVLAFCVAALTYASDLSSAKLAVPVSIALLISAVGFNAARARFASSWATVSTGALVLGVFVLNVATKDFGVVLRDAYKHTQMAVVYGERSLAPERQTQSHRFLDALHAADVLQERLAGRRYFMAYNGAGASGPVFRSVGSLLFAEAGNVLLSQSFQDFTTAVDAIAVRQTIANGRDLVVLTRAARLETDDRFEPEWTEELRDLETVYFAHYYKLRPRH